MTHIFTFAQVNDDSDVTVSDDDVMKTKTWGVTDMSLMSMDEAANLVSRSRSCPWNDLLCALGGLLSARATYDIKLNVLWLLLVLVRYQVLFDTDRYLNFVRYSILTL